MLYIVVVILSVSFSFLFDNAILFFKYYYVKMRVK